MILFPVPHKWQIPVCIARFFARQGSPQDGKSRILTFKLTGQNTMKVRLFVVQGFLSSPSASSFSFSFCEIPILEKMVRKSLKPCSISNALDVLDCNAIYGEEVPEIDAEENTR